MKKKLDSDTGSNPPACSPTPETSKAWDEASKGPDGNYYSTVRVQDMAGAMLNHSRKLERERDAAVTALKASLAYDEARFEYIRYRCFGEIPDRLRGSAGIIEASLEHAESEAGEEFRKLRDAALGLPENDEMTSRHPNQKQP